MPPAVVSESDKGIVAAWAGNDGAQMPPITTEVSRADVLGVTGALCTSLDTEFGERVFHELG